MNQIGVLGFQGSVEEHLQMLASLKIKAIQVNSLTTLSQVDGIIIPGGESTTFLKILHFSKLYEPLLQKIKKGLPVMATCAGIILLASHIDNLEQESMNLLPISVNRNGYGRQIESFCEDVTVCGLNQPFKAVFIRAPIITKVEKDVTVLAHDSKANPIFVQKNNILGLTFHPELTDDTRIHEMFIHLIDKI
jgi:5'-phosphate synthase pdxT subunit